MSSVISKDAALSRLQSRARAFGIFSVVFLIAAVLLPIIGLMSYTFATAGLIAGGVCLLACLACFSSWYLASSLYLHAAATR
jgi:hypothetical protein